MNIEEPIVTKPRKAKPSFYAQVYPNLQQIARDLGYNLLIHGSLDRDMDLVAVPWSDTPSSHFELVSQIDMWCNGKYGSVHQFPNNYLFSVLPGNRSSYVINLNRAEKFNNYTDQQWYIDLSITPVASDKQLTDCENALARLSDLKHIKDTQGKTEFYLAEQPEAWKRVSDYIEKYKNK